MTANRFGRIVTGVMLARAAEATIRAWQSDYLAEVGAQHGHARDYLIPFASFLAAPELDNLPDQHLPSCGIVVPGILEVTRNRSGSNATWDLRIGAFVKGKDRESTNDLMMLYAAVIRAIIVQHGSLGGDPRAVDYAPFATSTVWQDESYDILDFEAGRTLGACAVMFHTTVEGVVDSTQGPTVPSTDPTIDPGPWPTVQSTQIDVSVTADEE